MFQPEELKKDYPLLWSAGNGTEVWDQIRRQIAWDRPATSVMVARFRRFVWERLGAPLSVDDRDGLELSEAQLLIARSYGFESWRELEAQAS